MRGNAVRERRNGDAGSEKIGQGVPTVIFCSLLILQLASAEFSKGKDEKGIVHFKQNKAIPQKYSQNLEGEYWEKLTNPNFPLTLIDWQLITNPRSSDKYMDKRIIGTVKNNSEKNFLKSRSNLLFMMRTVDR